MPKPPYGVGDLRPAAHALNIAPYRTVVHPCVFEGEPTLFYEAGLHTRDPRAFALHAQFAQANGFRLREERRSAKAKVPTERRGKGLPMLVLGVGLLGIAGALSADGPPNLVNAANVAAAGASHATASDEFIVRDMLAWLRTQDFFVDPLWATPSINRVSPDEILRIAFGRELPAAADKDSLNVYGLYNFKDETIYLVDNIDLASARGRAILVHELVHYLQYQDGANNRVRCRNELESLAYTIEARYLREHQHRPSFTAAETRRVSRCS